MHNKLQYEKKLHTRNQSTTQSTLTLKSEQDTSQLQRKIVLVQSTVGKKYI